MNHASQSPVIRKKELITQRGESHSNKENEMSNLVTESISVESYKMRIFGQTFKEFKFIPDLH